MERAQATQAAIATAFNTAAERIEGLAKKLGQTGGSGPGVAQGEGRAALRLAVAVHPHYIAGAGL